MSGCLEWTGPTFHNGYGKDGKGRRVHRVAWEEANGPVPKGMMVLHTCDNRACHLLDHLYLGTAADNSHDMVVKGRISRPSAKLTVAQVQLIRESPFRNADLARFFGVNPSTISLVRRGLTWKESYVGLGPTS